MMNWSYESASIYMYKMSSEYTWSADFRLRIPTAFNMTEDMSVEFASKVSNWSLDLKTQA